jgi:hypothetical protein
MADAEDDGALAIRALKALYTRAEEGGTNQFSAFDAVRTRGHLGEQNPSQVAAKTGFKNHRP